MRTCWSYLLILGVASQTHLISASTCSFDHFPDQTSFGPAATLVQQPSYPFTASWGALIAFSADHCSSLCCQEPNCAAAVFDTQGALCYLKSSTGAIPSTFSAALGIDVYVLTVRIGAATPAATVPTGCSRKKGIAGDLTQAQAQLFGDALVWSYNWGSSVPHAATGTASQEFVPMAWTAGPMDTTSWSSSKHVLSFNEPNFKSQANLTPLQAAQAWPQLQAAAKSAGAMIVGPAVNFCGPASMCLNTDPYAWLQQFLDSCKTIAGGCDFSAVAFHSYTCSIAALNSFAHQYYTRFGKPLWLTEFACADDHSVNQSDFLQSAVHYLELNPYIERYAFFSPTDYSGGIIGNNLFYGDALTPLGQLYRSLYIDQQSCTIGSGSTGPSLGTQTFQQQLGCFVDQQPRALSGPAFQSDTMTAQLCASFCKSYAIFGMEWGRQCFCGLTVPLQQVNTMECNMSCSGNALEKCGSDWRLSVFKRL